jgi:hypothetical protein
MSSSTIKHIILNIIPVLILYSALECCGEAIKVWPTSDGSFTICAEIQQYRKELRNLKYTKDDLYYFPQIKTRTGVNTDSALQVKLKWALNIDLNKLNTSELREDVRDILYEVLNALQSKKEFEELFKQAPPVVRMEELNSFRTYHLMKQHGENVNISIDTNRLNQFYKYEFYLAYAKGTKLYDQFIQKARSDPFVDLLVDIEVLDAENADTLAILNGLIEKILHADERVRMLAFGYYGLPVAQQIRSRVNGRLNKLKRQKKIISAQDSAYVEFFYSMPFNAFGELFKKYSQMVDSMHIAVRYLPSDKPETFFEAAKIKDYLQK